MALEAGSGWSRDSLLGPRGWVSWKGTTRSPLAVVLPRGDAWRPLAQNPACRHRGPGLRVDSHHLAQRKSDNSASCSLRATSPVP